MRYFFVTIIAFLAALATFNSWVNVAGVGGEEVYLLAKRQAAHQKLVSNGAFDQRAWVKGQVEQGCPQTLVLGSSTSGCIAASARGGDRVLNAWLTGPMIEDFEAIAHLLGQNECVPGRVLLGVDFFLLDPKQSSDRWRTLWAERNAFVGDASWSGLHVVRGIWKRFKDLLSYQTTRDGLALVLSGGQVPAPGPVLVDDLADFCGQGHRSARIRHGDGHFSACPGKEKTSAEVAEIARSYVERDMHGIRSWRTTDEDRASRLFEVIDVLKRRGSDVLVFTPPYHPVAYKALRSDPGISQRLDALDGVLESRGRDAGAGFRNLRDPAQIGCGLKDFTDSHHGTVGCGARLLRSVTGATQQPGN